MREKLKDHIKSVLDGLQALDVDGAADMITEVADEIAGDRCDDLFNGAVLDGLRWGHHAAVVVEMGGGAMVRVIMPGGATITNEWENDDDADQPIKDALAAIHNARVTAAGVGSA